MVPFRGSYLEMMLALGPFANELVRMPTLADVERRLFAEAAGSRFLLARLEAETRPESEDVLLDLPISIYGGG